MKALDARLSRLEARHAGPLVIRVIMRDADGYTVNGAKLTPAEYDAWAAAHDGPDVRHIRIDATTAAGW